MGITEKLSREITARAPSWGGCRILYTGGGCFVAVAEMDLPDIGPVAVSVDGESAVIPMRGGKPVSPEEYARGESEDETVLASPGPDGNLVFSAFGEKALSPAQKLEIAAVADAMAAVLFPST